ncbi:hypothetical protein BFJ68_g13391 [Fusarium oxysporum]|uniref:MFS transporter, AGZA family, xanthine/uracil permease n=1 Tax=Fusarium oxysporum TaxID=5507 RepID=A0A420Q2G0_FUSOX|nr:hypothetical protein BFJ68_g13391 [Fusarium oxysporum]
MATSPEQQGVAPTPNQEDVDIVQHLGRSRYFGFRDFLDRVDHYVTTSAFGYFFTLSGTGHAALLAQSGGTCVCDLTDRHACDKIDSYVACKEDIRRDIVTATAAVSGLASFMFGFLTNLPVALAPGMGLNAYFTFQVVGYNGSGPISYRLALTAVFVEGLIFIFLALTGMRQWLVKLIPSTIKTATGVGIGFFLTEIGLSYSAGIGAITGGGKATPLALGGCPQEMLDEVTGMCTEGQMSSPKVTHSRNTPITYFPHTDEGDSRFDFFSQVVMWHPIERTLNQLDWSFGGSASQFALALFTFLYVDIIDATATLYSMVRFCGVVNPRDGDFPRSTLAYCTDAFFISVGALLGSSPVTAFIESGAGIAEGGRTGLTAMTTGLCFAAAVFFAPIFASVPPWATGCTLILPMVSSRKSPISSLIHLLIVLSGVFVYAVLNGLVGLVVWATRGYVEPREYDLKEYWTWKGSGRAPWFIRAIRHGRNTSQENDEDQPGDAGHAMRDLDYDDRRENSSSRTASSGKDDQPTSPSNERWER